ncbi:MAG: hypothetical protein SFY68_08345 [Candidatus Sumerlaeia bacterium]|nr:hypothetical protein [Candidatus Sumerlaeia bacterium]
MNQFSALLLSTLLVAASLPAQEAAPLVRRPTNIRVKKADDTPKTDPVTGGIGEKVEGEEATGKPTADPALLIVALVNSHTITREQLTQRVKARTRIDPTKLDLTPDGAGTVTSILGKGIVEVESLDEFRERSVREAVLKEEGEILQEWQDQMLLADEARRQQFLVTNQELQLRLAELDREFELSDQKVDTLLDAMGMSRAELESYVYDALLIEKLLKRFIELNYTEADFFNAYEQNPLAYRVPPKKKIAHYGVALLGNEAPPTVRKFKDETEAIRDRLRNGEDPEVVMESVNNLEFGTFGSILEWELESQVQNRSEEDFFLPEPVITEVMALEPGAISKVITNSFRSGGQEIVESFHVIKVLEFIPAKGETFEEALPVIKRATQAAARDQVLQMIKEAKTHRRMIRLSGIAPEKLPTPEELAAPKAPISLKIKAPS